MDTDRLPKPPAPLGLIAGSGELPLMVAASAKAMGRPVHAIGLRGFYNPELPEMCDRFTKAGLAQIGRWTRVFNRWGVDETIMVGAVNKNVMYGVLNGLKLVPDFQGAWLWYRSQRHDRRSQALLYALADHLDSKGVRLIDSTSTIQEHLADTGTMTKRQPSAREQADIAFGWPILIKQAELDIGQAIAAKDKDVIAVEAMEGTQRMIARAGELCRSKGWVLLKGANDAKDLRFDVPTVGPETIADLKRFGCTCLALRAGMVIMLQKQAMIEEADQAGISIVGV